jgi:hypothetical protein
MAYATHGSETGNSTMNAMYAAVLSVLVAANLVGCDSNDAKSARNSVQEHAAGRQRCAAMEGRMLGFGTVTDVKHVLQGDELIPMSKRLMLKVVLPFELPPLPAPRNMCRVWADLTPVAGSLIKVQVWLPDDWNEKMLALGGGGFNGGLFGASVAMREGSEQGYASVVTDVGHEMSDSAKFAHDSKEAFIDYGSRGNHATAAYTKELITAYYGKPAKSAYFQGGSNGGREALMEARRFPADYDGIIAGMPAMSFTSLMTSFLWNHQVASAAPGLKGKLGLVRKAVLEKCDALDGVRDGALENPLSCSFDPAELKCAGADAADCLNALEVGALQKIHQGPRLRDGTQVMPGLAVGSEAHPTEMDLWILGEKALQPAMGEEAFRWMVYGDPKWQKGQFDIDRDFPAAAKLAPVLDSDDPDLTDFLKRGGKLIIHHGWNDAAIPPENTIAYYEKLQVKVGPLAEKQVRLFMVPGMGHGLGRPGPEHYDMLGELDRWVEGGPAPERIVASYFDKAPPPFGPSDSAAKVVRTRPLCAWPKLAHYNGTGSTDDIVNFTCR